MFNIATAQSALFSGIQNFTKRIAEGAGTTELQNLVRAMQLKQGQEQQILGLLVAREEVGWRIYSDGNEQMRKLVSQA